MKHAFVYVVDRRGFELAAHSALSLARSQDAPCHIHMFCHQFTPPPSPRFAAALAKLGTHLVYDTIADEELERHPTCGHVTTPSLLKLLAVEKLIREYDRVVYLDHDLLIFRDLHIGSIGFGSRPLAAVLDIDPSDTGAFRHAARSRQRWASEALVDYFNSGFMAFAAENWHGDLFYRQYAAALHEHDRACRYKIACTSIDQCALNQVFEGQWVKLSATYNMQASAKFTSAWATATLRHYGGPRKFLPITPFRNDKRDVRYLNTIRQSIGLPTARFPLLYEALFRVNVARKYLSDRNVRRFLEAAKGHC